MTMGRAMYSLILHMTPDRSIRSVIHEFAFRSFIIVHSIPHPRPVPCAYVGTCINNPELVAGK